VEPEHQAGARTIVLVGTALWVVLVGAGYALRGLDFAVGVSIGGGLALVNFQLLSWATARALGLTPSRPRRAVFICALRWGGTAAALMAAIWIVDLDPAGLLVGLSVIVAAILFAAALGLIRG
jgi:hypothetical protein